MSFHQRCIAISEERGPEGGWDWKRKKQGMEGRERGRPMEKVKVREYSMH